MHFFYNANNDVLIFTSSSDDSNFEKVNDNLFFNSTTNEFNLLNAKQLLKIDFKNGYNKFNEEQINIIKNITNIEFEYDFASGVVVGHVDSCIEHPDSDHMHILKVNIGDTILDIVCGASNIGENMYVAVAKPNAYMQSLNLFIKPTKLRGVDSNGMVCSKYELGLEKDKVKGIWVLENETRIGKDIYTI